MMKDCNELVLLEICVDSEAGVAAAIAGGADRIELCGALELGGLTPSAGLVEAALERCRAAGVALHAMVRPRAGDFAYDRTELDLAIREGRWLARHGVDGLVFGACAAGQVDDIAAGRWVEEIRAAPAATGPALTFHRAIDLVADPAAAVAAVVALGFDRILTSGGARTAAAGAPVIRAMVDRAMVDRAGKGRAGDGPASPAIAIIAGSGIRPDNAASLLDATGVRELHASASTASASNDPRSIELGFAIGPRRHTDMAIVSALKIILDNKSNIRH